MEFPKKETDIVCLADRMYHGFFRHSVDFPKISKVLLMVTTNRFEIAKKDLLLSRAALKVAVKTRQQNFSNLKAAMKKCLKLAEVDCKDNPAKLSLIGIGWAKKNSQSLCPPAQPENLNFEIIAKDKIKLLWQRPKTSVVRCYTIEKREASCGCSFGIWQIAGSSFDESIILCGNKGLRTECRVIAQNSAGQSLPSNTVSFRI